MKYYVHIPNPTGIRNVDRKRIVLLYYNKDKVQEKTVHDIPMEKTTFEFEVPDDVPWIGDANAGDIVFDTHLEYYDSCSNYREYNLIDPEPVC